MAFQDGTFWVIAGTAAPIMALANVVSISDSIGVRGEVRALALQMMSRLDEDRNSFASDAASRFVDAPAWVVWVSSANLVTQACVLLLSLLTAAWSRSVVSPLIVACVLAAGLALVGPLAMWTSRAKTFAALLRQSARSARR